MFLSNPPHPGVGSDEKPEKKIDLSRAIAVDTGGAIYIPRKDDDKNPQYTEWTKVKGRR